MSHTCAFVLLIRSRRRLFHMGGKSKSNTTTNTQSHTVDGRFQIYYALGLLRANKPARRPRERAPSPSNLPAAAFSTG